MPCSPLRSPHTPDQDRTWDEIDVIASVPRLSVSLKRHKCKNVSMKHEKELNKRKTHILIVPKTFCGTSLLSQPSCV